MGGGNDEVESVCCFQITFNDSLSEWTFAIGVYFSNGNCSYREDFLPSYSREEVNEMCSFKSYHSVLFLSFWVHGCSNICWFSCSHCIQLIVRVSNKAIHTHTHTHTIMANDQNSENLWYAQYMCMVKPVFVWAQGERPFSSFSVSYSLLPMLSIVVVRSLLLCLQFIQG